MGGMFAISFLKNLTSSQAMCKECGYRLCFQAFREKKRKKSNKGVMYQHEFESVDLELIMVIHDVV